MEIKDELLDIEDIKRSKKSLIDLFIRRTAVITQTREDLVDLIIRDQWRNMLKVASNDTQVSELDVPMIGLFKISKSKSNKKIALHERKLSTYRSRLSDEEKQRNKQLTHIQRYERIISDIKNKLKQNQYEV